ncbi:MAG: hypothetical protein KAS73_05160 [Candidatus Sabulitectum sp.]|nr:hypothetical protein [Candidatus Sabulitectum sp.]
MKKWINDIDSQLLEIRNQYGHTYYQGFKTGKLNTDILKDLADQQNALFSTPSIVEKTEQILAKTGNISSITSETQRKASLLLKLLKQEEVEKSLPLVMAKSKILQAENAFVPSIDDKQQGYSKRREILSQCKDRKKRYDAYFSLQPLLQSIERESHDLIQLANEASAKIGYSNYFDFCLSQDDINSNQLENDIENALIATEESYKNLLEFSRQEIGTNRIEMFDFQLVNAKLLKEADRQFTRKSKISDLKKTLNSLAINLDELPVSIEVIDSPNAGTCFVLGSNDIRLTLGSEAGYFGHYVAFHEFGHALHYSLQPQSALLRDNGICMETMADFFANMLTDSEWLSEYTSMTEKEINNYLEMKKLVDSYRVRTMIRDTTFEFEIFKCPGESFEKIWSNLNKKIMGVSSDKAIWSPFSVYRPAYTKNYVYSHFLSKQLAEISKNKFGIQGKKRKAMLSLFERITTPGNMTQFKERIKSIGIDLDQLKVNISL